MNIKTLTLGPLQVNCYILWETEKCLVIDPGAEPEKVMKTCDELGLKIEAILLTHGHFDHVGGVKKIVETTGCALWMNRRDWAPKKDRLSGYLYPLANCDFTQVQLCEEGKSICAAGLTVCVLETPGHTQGSVCYRCGDALFSGDTLFAGSCGRTDLPGGDFTAIKESLKRLGALEGDWKVYPGHGETTTMENERKNNPYIY